MEKNKTNKECLVEMERLFELKGMFISISIVRELERIIAKRKITYLSMKHT
jgi:hypothetical protein